LEELTPSDERRVALTVSCSDSASIPKVENAGAIVEREGQPVQVMHNGLIIEEGCYYGPWMTEIISQLRGHHEPQEELVFHRILDRIDSTSHAPVMVEFGSFWTYYGMWFAKTLPGSRVIAVEPDPGYLPVGERNCRLNKLSAQFTFIQGMIGDLPGEPTNFLAESDGLSYQVLQHDLASVMAATEVDYIDLVLADVQGAESVLVRRGQGDFASRKVRFLIVSTHHHSISGDPLTHQRVLSALEDAGAHVIAEHSVSESFSGDGLIAVSFDDRDEGFKVDVSRARSRDSLFGELEWDLANARLDLEQVHSELTKHRQEVDRLTSRVAELERELSRVRAERNVAAREIDAMRATKLWTWTATPRRAYARLRSSRQATTGRTAP
jgi:FkbM family methyltransferase